MDYLIASSKIANSGLTAQSARMQVISENIANSRSTGNYKGADPYRRKTISFTEVMQDAGGVKISKIGVDRSSFIEEFDPGNPIADSSGLVKYPNVNMLVETADMREANRMYMANLQVIKQARDMISITLDLLKG
ncbi:flagellar basal body rod protein FlgC [Candidatus Liberibacter americanus]|uniref:Flagellar basal-body rod protein FlgC n=1 Tax=Candidatus Liberibacter americanus str. Sao Paulo TaxID=1261131 RepID=U6B3J5_9HYPH|nr:flagellar basal body rod protein FlgC [Candidatus Liberibacter americanus]AHA27639.1 Flagellar basal body rod protein [Candidatus Liberibacter americanus str. Sao Paulo]EMS36348.1 flagellar basal body rod protein FlgC [Candidatus Liberibacter americanus PW_SP]